MNLSSHHVSGRGSIKRSVGRPPVQRAQVASALRSRIQSKAWKPGDRLTPRRELVKELGVSTTALQAAIDQLHLEGYVETLAGRGTFVATRPPHIYQHGLILPESDSDFHRLLEEEAGRRYEADHHHRFKVYRLPSVDSANFAEAFAELASDVDRRVVAGIIISINPGPTQREVLRLADRSGMPVTLHGSRHDSLGLPIVRADMQRFFKVAVDQLRGMGRSRLGLLCGEAWFDRHGEHYESALTRAGLPLKSIWLQHVDRQHHRTVRRLVKLLFSLAPELRPDGLIVTEQDLIPTIRAALAELGLTPGEDVDCVFHCNLAVGVDPPAPEGFHWLGFEVTAFFDAFLDQLQAQKPWLDPEADPADLPDRGDLVRYIPPRSADDLAPASASAERR